jgi:hypothetical protein
MKLKAFRLKDTGDALLLANRRFGDEFGDRAGDPVSVWVPRSIITTLRVFGLRPGQEGLPNMVHADIPEWFVRKTPDLESFKEV